jgi:hypothetical protein
MLADRMRAFVKAYVANAVTFDGTNDYLTRGADLTGVSDGKEGIVSFWFKAAADGVSYTIAANDDLGGKFYIARGSGNNRLQVVGKNAAGSFILVINADTAVVAASGWVHFLASWNLAATSGWVYLDDAEDLLAGSTLTNDTIDYTTGAFAVGAEPDAGNKMAADIADLYINLATHLDLSVTANRRKFISATGKPALLGSDGSRPTGSAPAMFLSGATADWHTNKGAGGGFTENGALATAATSPSA